MVHIFSAEKRWIKVMQIAVKSFLALAVAGTFIFFSIIIYLLVQDYFYHEGGDDFNENGHETMVSEF